MAHLGPTLRRTRRRERPWLRALLAVAVSLALNLLALTRIDASWLGFGRVPEVHPVELSPLATGDWERNRQVMDGSRPAPPPAPLPPVPPPPTVHPGQVVDVGEQPPDPQHRRAPADSRYVSDKDRFVEKETRARVTKTPGQPTLPVPSSGTASQAPQQAAPRGDGGTADRTVAAAPGRKGTKSEPAKVASADRVADRQPLEDGKGDLATGAPRSSAAPEPSGGVDGLTSAGQRDPRLALSPSLIAKLAGGPSNDHLRDVEEGDGTFLSTREWKYATYFNRIKEAVSGAWDVRRAVDQRDPDRSIYVFKDRYTLVSVVLDDRGAVKDLAVARTSTVDFLDKVAVDAFRRAQPFSNPPAGLVDASGEIRFQFGFYLEAGHPGFRLFRGPMP